MDRAEQNVLAQKFASLHNPKDLLLLCNAFDGGSAQIIAAHPGAKAIASASYAVAVVSGTADDDLTLEDNLAGVRGIIAAGLRATPKKPVTIDLQDGYGDRLEGAIEGVIKLGAVGCNIEDFDRQTNALLSIEEAASRVALAKKVAARCGVPDFVVNARSDALFQGSQAGMDSVIRRGKAYLAAGATTVFVWGGPSGRGVSSEEIKRLVSEFGGMLNVSMSLREGFLNKNEIQALGVARVSMGPGLYMKVLDAYSSAVNGLLGA
ncbi:phosphoenolpyruvate phosphomutase-domain-containing protein [Mycena alexandri]|uniref:Phosphoenolpyruvate phosphomutase-domain-containing protein n=1 Tax=Mycena alexandri TaxID=1745969 RepID=A0AAD6T8C7_9AGAR|nr:phosphoenolpyruvate phosphomutase-domain-containing protein [Mycena alexandri]